MAFPSAILRVMRGVGFGVGNTDEENGSYVAFRRNIPPMGMHGRQIPDRYVPEGKVLDIIASLVLFAIWTNHPTDVSRTWTG